MKIWVNTGQPAGAARADYTIQVDEPAKLIRIVDQDIGNMSVTNDLERVLADVADQVELSLSDYSITYRDSTGTWDRLVATALDLENVFEVEVLPGPREPLERRDPMATS